LPLPFEAKKQVSYSVIPIASTQPLTRTPPMIGILRQDANLSTSYRIQDGKLYDYKYFYILRVRKLIYVEQEHITVNAVMSGRMRHSPAD
jgi:hypothetical protein